MTEIGHFVENFNVLPTPIGMEALAVVTFAAALLGLMAIIGLLRCKELKERIRKREIWDTVDRAARREFDCYAGYHSRN
jgi:hypothetical protein